jgi:NADPH:quinone reductase-like Zn-dependent oxidoreductase
LSLSFLYDALAGKITPIIDSTYPLSEVREAFRHMIEDELLGKVIITPAEAV